MSMRQEIKQLGKNSTDMSK